MSQLVPNPGFHEAMTDDNVYSLFSMYPPYEVAPDPWQLTKEEKAMVNLHIY